MTLYAARRSKEQGFTLVEVMITMVVVLLVLVGFIGANMAIQRASEAAYERTVALQDANRVIEQMRNLAAAGNFPQNVTGIFPAAGQVAGFANLTGEQVVVNYADPAADPLDTTVTVTWQENGVRQVNTALRTRITQRA